MSTNCPKVYPLRAVSATTVLACETSLFNLQTPFSMFLVILFFLGGGAGVGGGVGGNQKQKSQNEG